MYEKLLLNTDLMKVVLWFVNHDGEYSASLVQEEVMLDSFTMVQYLHLLDTLGVCKVTPDNEVEELFVKTCSDSDIVKSIQTIKEVIENKMGETPEVETVLNHELDDLKGLLSGDSTLDLQGLLSQCQQETPGEVEITREDVIKFLVMFKNCFMD